LQCKVIFCFDGNVIAGEDVEKVDLLWPQALCNSCALRAHPCIIKHSSRGSIPINQYFILMPIIDLSRGSIPINQYFILCRLSVDRMVDVSVELLNPRQLVARRRGPGRQCTARRSSTPPTWRTMRGSPGTEVGSTLVRTSQKRPTGCKGDECAGWKMCLPESLNPVAALFHVSAQNAIALGSLVLYSARHHSAAGKCLE
jgi:hypothetical protein